MNYLFFCCVIKIVTAKCCTEILVLWQCLQFCWSREKKRVRGLGLNKWRRSGQRNRKWGTGNRRMKKTGSRHECERGGTKTNIRREILALSQFTLPLISFTMNGNATEDQPVCRLCFSLTIARVLVEQPDRTSFLSHSIGRYISLCPHIEHFKYSIFYQIQLIELCSGDEGSNWD